MGAGAGGGEDLSGTAAGPVSELPGAGGNGEQVRMHPGPGAWPEYFEWQSGTCTSARQLTGQQRWSSNGSFPGRVQLF